MRKCWALGGLVASASLVIWAVTSEPRRQTPSLAEGSPGQPDSSTAAVVDSTDAPPSQTPSNTSIEVGLASHVRIRVRGEGGDPIEGASVEIVAEWDYQPDVYPNLFPDFGPKTVASGLTNAEGVADLRVSGRGVHFVVARHGIDAMTKVALDGTDQTVELVPAFPPAPIADCVTVAGRALGDGVPLPDARIMCSYGSHYGPSRWAIVQTDMAGRFILRGLPGPGTGSSLQLRTEGYVPLELWPKEEPGSVLVSDFDFCSGSRVVGRLVVPVGIDPRSVELDIEGWSWAPKTQASGEYQFHGLLPGETTISAKLQGYAEQCVEVVVPSAGEARAPDLRFGFGATIAGVLRSKDGAPLGEEEIDLCTPGFIRAKGPGSASTRTDATGAFKIQGASPGRYSLALTTMEREGTPLGLAEITIRPGEDSIGPLQLTVPDTKQPALGRIRGRVLGPGGPVPQAVVRWEYDGRGHEGVTGANESGEFELEARIGRVRLMALSTAHEVNLLTLAPVEVVIGDGPTSVDLPLSEGAAVSGRVSPVDRVLAEGARVRVESLDEPDSLRGQYQRADQQLFDDPYRLTHILPGRYAVVVYAERTELPWRWELRREVNLLAGREERVDFQLGARGVSALAVQLTGLPTGLEVTQVTVRWREEHATDGRAHSTRVPASFDFLPPGSAVVDFQVQSGTKSERTEWILTRPATVGPGDSSLLVTWPNRVGSISAEVDSIAPRRRLVVKGVDVEVERSLPPFATGSRVDHLAPGSYRCWIGEEAEVPPRDGPGWSIVQVTAGEAARLSK